MSGDPFQNAFNAVGSFVHNVTDTVHTLLNNGVPAFNGLEWLIQHLISLGEEPISFITTLISHIAGKGDVVSVMETFVQGVQQYGIEGFAQVKVKEVTQPVINTLNLHSATGKQLHLLHKNTVTTLTTKLQALTSGTGDTALQGNISAPMLTSFSNLTTRLNNLTSLLGNPQEQINNDFVNAISTYVKGCVTIDLAILAVELVAATGVITVPFEITLDAGVILLEALGFVIVVVIEGAIWLYRTNALHMQQQSFDDSQSQTIQYGYPQSWEYNQGKLKVDPPNNQFPGNFKAALIAALIAATAYGADILTKKFLDLSHDIQNQLFSDLARAYGVSPAALAAYLNYCLQRNPNLTILQLLDALSVRSIMQRDQMLIDDINTKMNDPRYKDARASLLAMQNALKVDMTQTLRKLETDILTTDYTTAVTNPHAWKSFQSRVNNADATFKGTWGTWQVAKVYGDQGKLVFVDTKFGKTDVDIAIKDGPDNHGIRLIQVKTYNSSFAPGSNDYTSISKNITLTQDAITPERMNEYKKRYKWFNGHFTIEADLVNVQGNGDWSQTVKQLHQDFPNVEVHTTTNPPTNDVDYGKAPNNPIYDPALQQNITQLPDLPNNWDPTAVGPVISSSGSPPRSGPTPQPVPTPVATPTPTS